MNNPIKVCAAVIRTNGKLLITSRPPGKQLENLWEFPGGKLKPGESEHYCLKRELKEELDAEIVVMDQIFRQYHEYHEKKVIISFYRAFLITPLEEIRPLNGQKIKWVPVISLNSFDFVPADKRFSEFLQKACS